MLIKGMSTIPKTADTRFAIATSFKARRILKLKIKWAAMVSIITPPTIAGTEASRIPINSPGQIEFAQAGIGNKNKAPQEIQKMRMIPHKKKPAREQL